MTDQEKYADKIAKLLRKAENSAATPAEAEAFVTKAQELMTTYAITEELLARARGVNLEQREEIVEETIDYTGIYRQALYDIGSAIAKANNCRCLVSNLTYKKPQTTRLHVIGFKSDVDRVRMLDASLQIQAIGGMRKAEKDFLQSWMSGMQKYKSRRDFIFGFAHGLDQQLARANRRAEAEAAAQEEIRLTGTGVDCPSAHATAEQSVTLVVRDKRERVQDWMDKTYGDSLRSVSRRYSSGSGQARGMGHEAGKKADAGTRGKVGGHSKGALKA